MPQTKQTLSTITRGALAAVSGGEGPPNWAELAKARAATPERCAYVKHHLDLLGATPEERQALPHINRHATSFTTKDLKDRLLMENHFPCWQFNKPAE